VHGKPVVLDEDRYESSYSPKGVDIPSWFRRFFWAVFVSGGHATYGGGRCAARCALSLSVRHDCLRDADSDVVVLVAMLVDVWLMSAVVVIAVAVVDVVAVVVDDAAADDDADADDAAADDDDADDDDDDDGDAVVVVARACLCDTGRGSRRIPGTGLAACGATANSCDAACCWTARETCISSRCL
jgi:hypothetical protein